MSDKMIQQLPEMMSGETLREALSVRPEYDASIQSASQTARLVALSDLYSIYIPSQMSMEIYSRLYLALLRSLRKKQTEIATRQQYENYKAIRQKGYSGIIGGADSMTIIGTSGIGKSSAISRALSVITDNRVIQTENPYARIIPCITVQCPFDCSPKGMLLEILQEADKELGSKYYEGALKARATADILIGSVSQVCLNNIGMIVVDEVQNVVHKKAGKSLIGMLTQLINNSGVSICMVGTPEVAPFFESVMYLARRSLGLQYGTMPYGDDFRSVCESLFAYQYVNRKVELSEMMAEWLYEHSGGVISILVALLHDAQEIAILNGTETLTIENLNEAYKKRLTLLHSYIQPTITHKSQTTGQTATRPKKKRTKKLQEALPDSLADQPSETLPNPLADRSPETRPNQFADGIQLESLKGSSQETVANVISDSPSNTISDPMSVASSAFPIRSLPKSTAEMDAADKTGRCDRNDSDSSVTIAELARKAKSEDMDMVSLLLDYVTVEEVRV